MSRRLSSGRSLPKAGRIDALVYELTEEETGIVEVVQIDRKADLEAQMIGLFYVQG